MATLQQTGRVRIAAVNTFRMIAHVRQIGSPWFVIELLCITVNSPFLCLLNKLVAIFFVIPDGRGLLLPCPGSNPYYYVVSGYVTIDHIHLVFADHVTFHETILIGIIKGFVVHADNRNEFFRGSW